MKSLEQLTNDLIEKLFVNCWILEKDTKMEQLHLLIKMHIAEIISEINNDYNKQFNEQSKEIEKLKENRDQLQLAYESMHDISDKSIDIIEKLKSENQRNKETLDGLNDVIKEMYRLNSTVERLENDNKILEIQKNKIMDNNQEQSKKITELKGIIQLQNEKLEELHIEADGEEED